MDWTQRRSGEPRGGSPLERLFGITNTEFIHTLIGNTQIMKTPRIATQSVLPENRAIWTLQLLLEAMDDFFYNTYHHLNHPALGQSPFEASQADERLNGYRAQTIVLYNRLFYFTTMPSPKLGHATVRNGTVTIETHIYASSELRDLESQRIPVRKDPFNIAHAFAYVRNYWVELRSRHYSAFKNLTEHEARIATEILKRNKQINDRSREVNDALLAAFFERNKKREKQQLFLIQSLREQAFREVYAPLLTVPATDPSDGDATDLLADEIIDSALVELVDAVLDESVCVKGLETT